MPRDTNGNYSLPAGTLVNSGDVVLPSQHNPAMNDIGMSISNSLSRDGQGGMRADLNLGGFGITNLSVLTCTRVVTTSGSGDNITVGAGIFISDVGIPNTARISGTTDSTTGYLKFGSQAKLLGVTAGGELTYGGATIWNSGNFSPSSYAALSGAIFSGDVGRDANFKLAFSGGNPCVLFDPGDLIIYDRSANKYLFYVGSTAVASIDGAGNIRALGNITANAGSV